MHESLGEDFKCNHQVACPPEVIAERLDREVPGENTNQSEPCNVHVVQYYVQTLSDYCKRDDF